MPFVEIPGLIGKVYVPERQEESFKKYPCKDCYFCQSCSDNKCKLCLNFKNCECQTSLEK